MRVRSLHTYPTLAVAVSEFEHALGEGGFLADAAQQAPVVGVAEGSGAYGLPLMELVFALIAGGPVFRLAHLLCQVPVQVL